MQRSPERRERTKFIISEEDCVTSRKTAVKETIKFCENTGTAIKLNGTKHGFVQLSKEY